MRHLLLRGVAPRFAPRRTLSTLPCPILSGQSATLKHQDELPKLPVTPLDDICANYLSALGPHLDAAQRAATTAAVAEFQAQGGAGPALHAALLEYDAGVTNYQEDFYADIYLSAACSNCSLNPAFVLEHKQNSFVLFP